MIATPWQEIGGSEQEHKEERVDFTVSEGNFQGGGRRQGKRAILGDIEGSMSG